MALSMSCGIQCLCLPHFRLQQTELFCRAGPVRLRHLAWLWPWDGCRARCLIPCCSFLMTSQWGKSHCFVQDTFACAVGSTQGGDCSTWFLTVTVTSLPHQTQVCLQECGCTDLFLVVLTPGQQAFYLYPNI